MRAARWAGTAVAGFLVTTLTSSATVASGRIVGARVALDLRTAGSVGLRYDLEWRAAERSDTVVLYLVQNVEVRAARSDGATLPLKSSAVAGTRLVEWKASLPAAAGAGETRSLTLEAMLPAAAVDGIRVASGEGYLLPGSGWFPQEAPEADALVSHATTFVAAAGAVAVAAGERRGAGSWQSAAPSRPYAVWGPYSETRVEARAGEGQVQSFDVWRRKGATGDVPRADAVAGLIRVLSVGLGDPCGNGDWKIVDVGGDVLVGGARTLFWDEQRAAAVPAGDGSVLHDRDVSGALAASFWTECVPTHGDLAAFLSRSVALHVGDVAYSAWDGAEERWALEAITIGARRAAFLESLDIDRPLRGLIPSSPGADRILATRGALVAHLIGSIVQDRTRWVSHLGRFRTANAEEGVDFAAFSAAMADARSVLSPEIVPLIETKDLPDFHIVSHAPRETKMGGLRYGVELGNRGTIAGFAEVATFDAAGRQLYVTQALVKPGKTRTLSFANPDRVARVVVEPRGLCPQPDLSEEIVQVSRSDVSVEDLEEYVPSFPLLLQETMRSVSGLSVSLDGVTITDFDGWVSVYGTHHGPSGACLMGSGTLTLSPGGDFSGPWREAMGRDALSFEGASEIWLRFPPAAWDQIEPHLGEAVGPDRRQEMVHRQIRIYQFSFPTYFYEGSQAQVPPPGSSVVVFTGAGGERRGFANVPLPDGKVLARFWDHLHGETLWEEKL